MTEEIQKNNVRYSSPPRDKIIKVSNIPPLAPIRKTYKIRKIQHWIRGNSRRFPMPYEL